jgi:hypothetical protein
MAQPRESLHVEVAEGSGGQCPVAEELRAFRIGQ